jgi:hypothetical protein
VVHVPAGAFHELGKGGPITGRDPSQYGIACLGGGQLEVKLKAELCLRNVEPRRPGTANLLS